MSGGHDASPLTQTLWDKKLRGEQSKPTSQMSQDVWITVLLCFKVQHIQDRNNTMANARRLPHVSCESRQ